MINSVKSKFKIFAVFCALIFICGCSASKSVTASGNNSGGGIFTGFSIGF